MLWKCTHHSETGDVLLLVVSDGREWDERWAHVSRRLLLVRDLPRLWSLRVDLLTKVRKWKKCKKERKNESNRDCMRRPMREKGEPDREERKKKREKKENYLSTATLCVYPSSSNFAFRGTICFGSKIEIPDGSSCALQSWMYLVTIRSRADLIGRVQRRWRSRGEIQPFQGVSSCRASSQWQKRWRRERREDE